MLTASKQQYINPNRKQTAVNINAHSKQTAANGSKLSFYMCLTTMNYISLAPPKVRSRRECYGKFRSSCTLWTWMILDSASIDIVHTLYRKLKLQPLKQAQYTYLGILKLCVHKISKSFKPAEGNLPAKCTIVFTKCNAIQFFCSPGCGLPVAGAVMYAVT